MKSKDQTNKKEAAKAYVESQLDVLRKYGSVANVSAKKYNNIVKQVQRASAS
jgi:hypothetical protein